MSDLKEPSLSAEKAGVAPNERFKEMFQGSRVFDVDKTNFHPTLLEGVLPLEALDNAKLLPMTKLPEMLKEGLEEGEILVVWYEETPGQGDSPGYFVAINGETFDEYVYWKSPDSGICVLRKRRHQSVEQAMTPKFREPVPIYVDDGEEVTVHHPKNPIFVQPETYLGKMLQGEMCWGDSDLARTPRSLMLLNGHAKRVGSDTVETGNASEQTTDDTAAGTVAVLKNVRRDIGTDVSDWELAA